MSLDRFPAPLSRFALSVIPAPLLQRMIGLLMHGMRRKHPRLFQNLSRLKTAVVCVEPTDLPHQFVLRYGNGSVAVTLCKITEDACDARVKGKLGSLLDMLEGRMDGDMLFFARDIDITGDTSVIVGLRNTLDREEINLLDDVTALLGPFAAPARQTALLLNLVVESVRNRLADIYESRHPALANTQSLGVENESLRMEIKTLKTRLAKLEVQQKKREATAL